MDYLVQLSNMLHQDHATYLEEIHNLGKGLDQINSIIQAQLQYTKVNGLEEKLTPEELIPMAVEMSRISKQAGIEIKYDYQYRGAIRVERHKVIQILINLINNAKRSLDSTRKQEKFIWISTKALEPDWVQIEIKDNGAGIEIEAISKIFTFDADAISNPHSLDLHASANAAKSMHGNLKVSSDRRGMGSSFVLELPKAG